MPVRNIEHEKLSDDLLFHFGSRPDIRLWGRDVGFDERINLAYGIAGECDLDGIVAPWGIRLGIEVKTGNAKLTPKQVLWKNMILKFGGIHIEARSVIEALQDFEIELARWKDKNLR